MRYTKSLTVDVKKKFVGASQAPSKYKILESCPSLETLENMRDLIGAQILHTWDDTDRQGWFEGRVHGRNLNTRDLVCAPTVNFSVRYRKSLTVGVKNKKLFHFVMWFMS